MSLSKIITTGLPTFLPVISSNFFEPSSVNSIETEGLPVF